MNPIEAAEGVLEVDSRRGTALGLPLLLYLGSTSGAKDTGSIFLVSQVFWPVRVIFVSCGEHGATGTLLWLELHRHFFRTQEEMTLSLTLESHHGNTHMMLFYYFYAYVFYIFEQIGTRISFVINKVLTYLNTII